MTRVEDDPDFALGLKAADTWPVAGARVDEDKGPSVRIDGDAFRGNNAHKPVIHGALQASPIQNQFRLIAQYMRHRFGHVLAVLIAALSHDVPEQHRALSRVDHVVHRRAEGAEHIG